MTAPSKERKAIERWEISLSNGWSGDANNKDQKDKLINFCREIYPNEKMEVIHLREVLPLTIPDEEIEKVWDDLNYHDSISSFERGVRWALEYLNRERG